MAIPLKVSDPTEHIQKLKSEGYQATPNFEHNDHPFLTWHCFSKIHNGILTETRHINSKPGTVSFVSFNLKIEKLDELNASLQSADPEQQRLLLAQHEDFISAISFQTEGRRWFASDIAEDNRMQVTRYFDFLQTLMTIRGDMPSKESGGDHGGGRGSISQETRKRWKAYRKRHLNAARQARKLSGRFDGERGRELEDGIEVIGKKHGVNPDALWRFIRGKKNPAIWADEMLRKAKDSKK